MGRFSLRAMKTLTLLAVVFALNSCNTTIGMWRDTKQGWNWTQQKIQGNGGGGGGDAYGDPYGAPVY